MNNVPLCIWHSPCLDGHGAAWAIRCGLGGLVEFHPGVYGQDPPDVTGRDVILADFSYKRPVLEKLIASAHSLLVLDHHAMAQADLAFLPGIETRTDWYLMRDYEHGGAAALFDLDRSGAGIAWDLFNLTPRPALINYVEDRDLWRFKLPGSREYHAALSSYPFDFDVWDELAAKPVDEMVRDGASIDRKHLRDIDVLLKITKRRMRIGGYDVPVANLPITMGSDAGMQMAAGEPFAAVYMDTATNRAFSLRSLPGGIDVAEIAAKYGGGGHKTAAGFQRPLGWNGDDE